MTNTVNHTPGPILTEPQASFIRSNFTNGKAEKIIKACECHNELLEALRNAEHVLVDWFKSKEAEHGHNWNGGKRNVLDDVREAIAKAERR